MNKKSLLSAFLSLLLSSMLLVTFCSAAPAHAAQSWIVQTVDLNGQAYDYGYSPIVLDSGNSPHIVYTGIIPNHQNDVLRYASWNGSAWSAQTVAYAAAFDLKLDAHNTPHILYETQEGLKYAYWTGSNWINQTVDANGARFGVLALDSSSNPHVAYTDGKTVKYARLIWSGWSIQTVDNISSDIPFQLSFALDSDNTPYIVYSPSSYADNSAAIPIRAINVKLAVLKNSSWSIEPVLASYNLGGFGNMVLDSKGHLNFICTQHHFVSVENMTSLSTLLYASWNGAAWTTQTVVSNIRLDDSIGFLALDFLDYPHISFVISGTLMYASWTGAAWNVQNTSVSAGSSTSLLSSGL